MKNRIAVMTSVVLSILIASMDATIMNTTMPIIAEELGGIRWFAWSFASYMIFSTVMTPIAGRLSDMFGRKRVFAGGIVLFLIGSLLCGSAQSMVQLVLYRAVQGLGAGTMTPFPAIIAGDLYKVEDRGKIQALFSGMWGLSAVLAPMFGAFFVEFASWRWIFYINLPICLLALLLLIPYREAFTPKRAPVDAIGAMLFAAAISLGLSVTVLERGQLAAAAGAAVLLLLFVRYERRQAAPMIPLGLLKHPVLGMLNAGSFVICAALFGASNFIPMFLQFREYSLFASGFALIGMSVGWIAMSVPSGKWMLRFGYRPLLLIACGVIVLSGAMLLALNAGTGFFYVFLVMIVQGAGFGLLMTVATLTSQQLVEPHEMGVSTSLSFFSRNIGTAFGVTIMGAILNASPDFLTGIAHLFRYGFAVSLVALAAFWFVRATALKGRGTQHEKTAGA